MCEHCPDQPSPLEPTTPALASRRALLSGLAGLPLAVAVAHSVAAQSGRARAVAAFQGAAPQPPIVRRAEWGGNLPPKGPLPAEDVKFLLVHHTAEPGSDYQASEVPELLRGIYRFHTGASKGWPDVAYNFFVDKFGTIYEGRTGSIDGPVRGSATGGNQGYSQLCCFLGDFEATPPSAPALESMYSLLAWLADRYQVDTSPGAKVTFTSMGSNRWPAGATVEAATISAHRDMSQTTCPGTACYMLVRSTFPQEVTARRGSPSSTTMPSTTTAAPTTAATAVPESTVAPTTDAPTTTTTVTKGEPGSSGGKRTAASKGEAGDGASWPLVLGVGLVGAAVTGGAVAASRKRSRGNAFHERRPATIAWRTTGGRSDPLLHALAASARPIVANGGEWWDELSDHWRVASPVAAGAGESINEPSSFLVASDGERALIRLVGEATGVAELADGSTSELTANGVTKVWLTSADLRLVLDGATTEISVDGMTGPLDRSMDPHITDRHR